MNDIQQTLLNIVKPLCEDSDMVIVKQMETINDNEILLYVYASNNDIGRLIGKKGIMATSIRQMMQVVSKVEKKRINVKFEAL